MQESPPLKSDWCGDIKLLSVRYGSTSLYIKRSSILPLIGSSETGLKFLTSCLLSFLCMSTTLAFFQWIWKTPVSRHDVKIIRKNLQIALSLNLSIQILILSRPWALLGSDFRITFKMSFSENLAILKHVFVCGKSWGGISISFFKREHCLAKWEWSNYKLILMKYGGYARNFFTVKKTF